MAQISEQDVLNAVYDSTNGVLKTSAQVTSDIQIGAVELKDHDGSDRAEVTASNELKVIESNVAAAIYADDADWTDSTSSHLLVGGLYQSSPQSITDGDVGPFQVDANGKLKVSTVGEDSTADVLKTEQQYSYSYVAAAGADNVIKASAGFLHAIILGKWVSGGVVEVSDHASDGDGNVVIYLESGATDESGFPKVIPVNAAFSTGITADLTSTTNVTFIYR